MSDEREENVRAADDETGGAPAVDIAQGIMDAVEGSRACVVLLHTDDGAKQVGAGDLTERLGLIEHARAMARAEAISRRRSADVQFLAFLEAFDAWAAKDTASSDGDAVEFEAMLQARGTLRERGWG